MTHLYKAAAAAIASFALLAGASAASAQTTYGFTQAGEAVTASGQLIQFVNVPGVIQTTCNVDIHGTVASDGQSITFDSYDGVNADGVGNLACNDSLTFPIIVTAPTASSISLDEFLVGTRGGPCFEEDYGLAYSGNVATFSGAYFGDPAICRASGSITLTTDSANAAVEIVANP